MRTPEYQHDRISLHLADCMEVMAEYPDKHFDLAVVDPPYGIGEKLTSGGTWAAKYSSKDSKWDVAPTEEYFSEVVRVSKNWIVWGGNYFTRHLDAGRCFLVWDKVAKMDTMADCELALTSFDRNAKSFSHVRNTCEKRIHLCQKPVKLYAWIYANYAKPGMKVLDTHLGSGSNAIAAHYAGMEFVGCELDADYFAAACKRVYAETRQQELFTL